jgi:REP element-mobilizing transposase RayT
MPNYRRAYVPGGTFFLTVVTERRAKILCGTSARACLRRAFRDRRQRWPSSVEAIVLLPDHLHAVWTLPRGDTDYPARWGWIKKEFTKAWLAEGDRSRRSAPPGGVTAGAGCGNATSGSTWCRTKTTWCATATTSTTTRLNTAWWPARRNGLTPRSIDGSSSATTLGIGAARRPGRYGSMTSMPQPSNNTAQVRGAVRGFAMTRSAMRTLTGIDRSTTVRSSLAKGDQRPPHLQDVREAILRLAGQRAMDGRGQTFREVRPPRADRQRSSCRIIRICCSRRRGRS